MNYPNFPHVFLANIEQTLVSFLFLSPSHIAECDPHILILTLQWYIEGLLFPIIILSISQHPPLLRLNNNFLPTARRVLAILFPLNYLFSLWNGIIQEILAHLDTYLWTYICYTYLVCVAISLAHTHVCLLYIENPPPPRVIYEAIPSL